jgi:FkbM family methyltransferase
MRPVIDFLHKIHRWVSALLAHRTMAWALAGEPSPVKILWLRRVVMPGLAARREDFAHELRPGVVFHGNTADFIPLAIRIFGRWEPAMTAFLTSRLSDGRVFVDVGANIGWFDLVAAPLVSPTGSVVAIEASPGIHATLEEQVRRNALDNVRTVNEAVGSADGWVQIVDGPSWNSGQTGVLNDVQRAGSVVCRALDKILTPEESDRCRIVKIDVEGAEFEVVRGMGRLLDQLPEDAEIVVEVGPGRVGTAAEVDELWQTFTSRGYAAYELPNEYTVRFLRDPVVPTTLRRIAAPRDRQTDVVFSRIQAEELTV